MKYFLILLFSLNINLIAADDIESIMQPINPFFNSLDEEVKVINLDLSPNSLTIKRTYISKTSNKAFPTIMPPFKKDKYLIRLLDKDNNELLTLGIGNPFYANAQHIGYEDREVMGGLVSAANIEIAIPINIDPQYIVISEKDSQNNIKDIQKIEVPSF